MNKTKLLFALGVICLLAVSVSAGSLKNKPKSKSKSHKLVHDTDAQYQAVCTSSDRGNSNCGYSATQGCLCYNNGTCLDTYVNRCRNCSDTDIFSAIEGQSCPKQQPYLCQPPVPGVKYTCQQGSWDSCVCSLNGTCFDKSASHCITCQNPNILAVFENKTCPSQFLQTRPSQYFVPSVCDKSSAKSVSCLKTQTPGCVCYSNNNTCEYRTDTNKCLLCFSQDVASFNQGEYCPKTKGKMFVCDASSNDKCSSTKNSCVCQQDGTCQEMNTNHCKACNNNALSVFEGGQCPIASYASLDSAKTIMHKAK